MIIVPPITITVLIFATFLPSIQAFTAPWATAPWSFIVMADWHGAEPFAIENYSKYYYKQQKWQLRRINNEFAGDFVALVGDTLSGKWYKQKWINKFMPGKSPKQAVYDASVNAFSTIKKSFNQVGYDKILYALGDHELGDNPWQPNTAKVRSLSQYRKGFVQSLYLDQMNGEYIYKDMKLGNTFLTPYGTPFQYTSFAHVHKNVLFVTLNVFKQLSSPLFQKKSGGIGVEME